MLSVRYVKTIDLFGTLLRGARVYRYGVRGSENMTKRENGKEQINNFKLIGYIRCKSGE